MYPRITTNEGRLSVARVLLGLENENEPGYQEAKTLENIYVKKAIQSEKAARDAALLALPIATYAGLQMLFTPSDNNGFIDFAPIIRLAGFTLTPLALLFDALKLFPMLLYSAAKGIETGIRRLQGLTHVPSNDTLQAKEIYASFQARYEKTLLILTALELIDPATTATKRADNDLETIYYLNTMTLLYTAFDSRELPQGQLQLANGRILKREKCPQSGSALFDCLDETKTLIKEILPPNSNEAIDALIQVIDKINAVIITDNHVDFKGELTPANELLVRRIGMKLFDLLKTDMHTILNKVDKNYAETSSATSKRTATLSAILQRQVDNAPTAPEDVLLDPVHFTSLNEPVIANDGVAYSRKTAQELKDKKQKGVKGKKIESYEEATLLQQAMRPTTSASGSKKKVSKN